MKTRQETEFGDFQTPPELAGRVCQVVASRGFHPAAIVEPTCGRGSFLLAALRQFPEARVALGVEINGAYLEEARQNLSDKFSTPPVELCKGDFFRFDWPGALKKLPEPILIIGNPPWVTNAGLGGLDSHNLPAKSNFQKRRGLDAVTGKSNFDIAEWMIIHLLEWLDGRRATVAMLVKSSVARKALAHAWKSGIAVTDASMLTFDAHEYFGAAVDACLLVCALGQKPSALECRISDLDHPDRVARTMGYEDGMLLADKAAFDRWHPLLKDPLCESPYRWRSGIKHDCAAVMELRQEGAALQNGLSEPLDIEDDCVFPLAKGSDVARNRASHPTRAVIIPQKEMGQDTAYLALTAPRTWKYLCAHGEALDARRSSIYRNRPRFSIFGVGKYTFAPWKVAICALYKTLEFAVVGSHQGKPVVLDDTCYHLSCGTQEEANLLAAMMNSRIAKEFLEAFIFWDAKRPVTIELLSRLDITALADELGEKEPLVRLRPDLSARDMLEKTLF